MIEQVLESFDITNVCYIAIFVIIVSMIVEAIVHRRENARDKR